MRSGGGVLCISACQLVVGLCLLGIYEGYKQYYFGSFVDNESIMLANAAASNASSLEADLEETVRVASYESPLDFRSPMGFTFYLSIANNVFSVFGLAGVLNGQRELIIAFFTYNAAQMVVAFHYFVDLCTDSGIAYRANPDKLTSFEKAAAAFIFFNFVLSVAATVFAVKALEEVKLKQREDYNRLTVLSDTLQYESDHP